jgi:hypothetical protein
VLMAPASQRQSRSLRWNRTEHAHAPRPRPSSPNDIEFSGERKRVHCDEGLDGGPEALGGVVLRNSRAFLNAAACVGADGG